MKNVLRERLNTFTKLTSFGALIAILGFVPGLPGLSLFTESASAAPEVLFSDSFETGDFSAWDTTSPSNWVTVSGNASEGTRRADGSGTTGLLTKAIDTTGYENIRITFDFKLSSFEADDYTDPTFFNGSSTIQLGRYYGQTGGLTDANWRNYDSQIIIGTLNGAADNPDFSITLKSIANAANDKFLIDNVVITGEPIVLDSTSPTISYASPLDGAVIDTTTPTDDVVFTATATDDVSSANELITQFTISGGSAGVIAVNSPSTAITNPFGDTFTFTKTVQQLRDDYGFSEGDSLTWTFFASDQAGNFSSATSGQTVQFGTIASAVTNTDTAEMFSSLQEAHDDSDTDSGDTLLINQNLTTTSQVTITKSLTIDGGGNTLDANFVKTNNSNNSAIGVQADNVNILNLTIMSSGDEPWPLQLHGINVFESMNVNVTNVVAKDFYGTGIAYNGSTGTIQDVHTENNAWHGINVDKNGADVSVIGNNSHIEAFADIYVDNDTLNVTVNAPGYDWERSGLTGRDNDRVYRLLAPIEACNSSVFDSGFTNGSVNGQNGWMSNGPIDQEVTDNRYGYTELGCKVLRISNGVTSGGFGNQTFSAPASELAGEDTTNDHYEASFTFGSTMQGEQSGLALSISPDDGTGNRMSYVGLADKPSGVELTFYDTDVNGVFVPTVLGTYNRSDVHTVTFVIDFVDGEFNDVVKVYVDGVLQHTGTTWEQYYRYSSEQAGNGNVVPNVDRLIFRAAGTAVPSNQDNGFVFDNVLVSTSANDSTKPVTTVVSPVDNSSHNADFTINVNSTDVGTGVVKAVVNVYGGSGFLYSCVNETVNPASNDYDFSCVIDVDALSDGNYYIKTNTKDGAGNLSNTVTHRFKVDTTPPEITVKPGYVGDESTKVFSNVSFKLFDSNAADKYVLNGTEKDFTDNKWSDANFSNIQSLLNEGTNELVLYDVAGNSTAYEFTYDMTAPTVTVKASSIGTDPVFSNVSFKLFDQYRIDKVVLNGIEKDLSNNKWSDLNNVKPGTFGAVEGSNTLIVYDEAGNSTTVEFTLDSSKPSISIINPVNGSLTNDSNVAVNGTASDLNGIERVDYTITEIDAIGGSYVASIDNGTATGTDVWNFNLTGFSDGFYRVKVQAFDVAGNWKYRYHDIEIDLTAPSVTIDPIADSTDTTPTITGTVDDLDAIVTVTVDGTDYTATNNGDGTWTLGTVDPLSVGDYTAEAYATDVAENVSDPVATEDFSVIEEPTEEPEEGEVLGTSTTNGNGEDITTPTTNGIGGDNTPTLFASLNNGQSSATGQSSTDDSSNEESDESESADDGAEVLQSTTDGSNAPEESDDSANEENNGCFEILGICWYWWALPIVAIILYYGYRKFTEE